MQHDEQLRGKWAVPLAKGPKAKKPATWADQVSVNEKTRRNVSAQEKKYDYC